MSSQLYFIKNSPNVPPIRGAGSQKDDYDSSDLSSNESKTSSGGDDSDAPSRRFSSGSDTSLSEIDDRIQKAMKNKKMIYPMTITKLPLEVIQVSAESPKSPSSPSPEPVQPSMHEDDITVKLIERSVISGPVLEPPPKLIELKIESYSDSMINGLRPATSPTLSSSHSPSPSLRKTRGKSAERVRKEERSKREVQKILAQVREENEWEYMKCGLL
ncbi:unnamed protein product [Lepeophtheirus salmonis]|uniref:(salmon louse) hypothetical protein n=1 Tax=Lepeophtheirus salmonis TaxID=72036 RepID=A0A7R8D5F4_LEPSM|nr:unnamed protein product [Lepeophtheirus salmonis]CAF3035324.1 unnamed protein product [Lepeophtheirus salmonis]